MSKGYDLKKLISNWKKEGTLEMKKCVLRKVPKKCVECNSKHIYCWGETDEEIVFRCSSCERYYSIPFNQDDIHFYFAY